MTSRPSLEEDRESCHSLLSIDDVTHDVPVPRRVANLFVLFVERHRAHIGDLARPKDVQVFDQVLKLGFLPCVPALVSPAPRGCVPRTARRRSRVFAS